MVLFVSLHSALCLNYKVLSNNVSCLVTIGVYNTHVYHTTCNKMLTRHLFFQGYDDSDNLHYAALRKHKISRPNRQQNNTQTECVYSGVRH